MYETQFKVGGRYVTLAVSDSLRGARKFKAGFIEGMLQKSTLTHDVCNESFRIRKCKA